jgi:hypothetical protein
MRKKVLGAIAAVAATAVIGAAPASAATEFGSHCLANRAEEGLAYADIQLSQGGVPTAAPVSGVVTSWKIRLIGVPFFVPQQLKVYRPTASPLQFQVVGESAVANVASGENTFPTRVPIQTGDRIGLFANAQFGALFCAESPEAESPGNSTGFILGNPTAGSTATVVESAPETLVPVAAVIEPDADADGFGDETQDACPQSAATQLPCPAVTLSTKAKAQKGSVIVTVTTNTAAPVKVEGVVNLGKGKKATIKGSTKTLAAGVAGKFTLKLSKAVKAKLAGLSRKRSLTLKVTVSGTSLAGQVTTKVLKVKLKGQAKD